MDTWIDSFLDYLKTERNYSARTVESYSESLVSFNSFISGLEEKPDWAMVKADDVREWMVYLMDDKGLSATSVKRHLSALRSMFRYLRRMEYVYANPMEKIIAPKTKKPLPVFVKENEMDRLLEIMAEDRSLKGVRDRLIVMTFYEAGLRLSELISLNVADIDTQSMQLKVTGKGNKQRVIPFGNELKDEINTYLTLRSEQLGDVSSDEPYIVGNKGGRLSEFFVAKVVKDSLAMVTTQKKKSPHVLRHSFATAMLNNNADLGSIQKLLGHSLLSTTEVYTHLSFQELRKEYKGAHPRSDLN